MNEKPYKIEGVVPADEVPDWTRRESKWDEIVEKVLDLEPGKSLKVVFPDKKTADRARNAVRDAANLRLVGKEKILRTRMVKNKGKEDYTAFLTMTKKRVKNKQN
jgi:gamma-glutamylcysteine synthetase